jgi:hypothetical protein
MNSSRIRCLANTLIGSNHYFERNYKRSIVFIVILLTGFQGVAQERTASPFGPIATDYASIQAALDANRGRPVYLPAGDHRISEKLYLTGDQSGLFGPGRIIQTNVDRVILEIEHASQVQLRDITLTRADPDAETRAEGLLVGDCHDATIENVRVIDNRSRAAAISVRNSSNCRIINCVVRNYKCITVEDRLTHFLAGYAFQCIDGSGIVVNDCRGTVIQGNRVVEERLRPLQETQQKYGLGKIVKKAAVKPERVPQQVWDSEYTDNWHQGSGIVVTSPETTDRTQIVGNTIEYAAQGIDLHSDHVIVSNNIVFNSHVGMKAMHGSRNVLIIGNQFIKNDLWSIGLMPGAASHAALDATPTEPARGANIDGGSLIANNIISDFGQGDANWLWGNQRSPFLFDGGQIKTNPPLTDVLIQGNIVFDSGRQKTIVDGKAVVTRPTYRYAVIVARDNNPPEGLHFQGNLFHGGTDGIANVELTP